MYFGSNPLVVDIGSGFIKAGQCSAETPSLILPSTVGKYSDSSIAKASTGRSHLCFGAEVKTDSVLSISRLIERGQIVNWDDFEAMMTYLVEDKFPMEEEKKLMYILEESGNAETRVKLSELFMEKVKLDAFYAGSQPVHALYSSGRTTGLVIDSGEGVTTVSSIYEGYNLPHASKKVDWAGADLTLQFQKSLAEKGIEVNAVTARDIKETMCRVSADYDSDHKLEASEEKTYALPDGTNVKICKESFEVPEMIFQPSLFGKQDMFGIHQLVHQSILASDESIHSELRRSICVFGGNTLFSGYLPRLQSELKNLSSENKIVQLKDNPLYQAWKGGEIMASFQTSTFGSMWITKHLYDEEGPSIINRRCV
jgi:actin